MIVVIQIVTKIIINKQNKIILKITINKYIYINSIIIT